MHFLILCALILTSVELRAQMTAEAFRPPRVVEPIETIDQLNRLAAAPGVQDLLSFLKAIPSDAFQHFTLVTNSRSLQRGSGENTVSNLWPRVLRSSKDGKITFSYVCNAQGVGMDRIEVIFFDDTLKIFRTMTYDLNQRKQVIDQNVCLSCHAAGMKRETFQPIWAENGNWRDCDEERGISVYGGINDIIGNRSVADRNQVISSVKKNPHGCDQKSDRAMVKREAQAFKNFRELQKENPCYSLLPWSEDSTSPYHDGKTETTGMGPNQTFTANFSKLTAKKNARVLKRDKHFKKIEPYLQLEGLGCLKEEDYKFLSRLLNKDVRPYSSAKASDPQASRPVLYRYSTLAGLRHRDWNLTQNANEPSYHTGIAPMAELILEEFRQNDEEMNCEKLRDSVVPINEVSWDPTASAVHPLE